MKIGVISDIHGNIEALNKVLEEFEKRKVDKIICCGDIIGIGPFPEEAVQKLMQYKEKIIGVRGNHEQYYFKGIPKNIHDDKRPVREEETKNHKWTQSNLSKESIEFLKDFPLELEVEINGKKIYVTHYPINADGSYRRHIKKATAKEIEELFDRIKADVYLYGHTHVANFNKLNEKMYINPGSLGCPGTTSIAKCGILTVNNEINYESLNIKYNAEKVRKNIKDIKYPLYKKILTLFYGSNDDLVQVLGEFVNVENIKKTKYTNLYTGVIFYNSERIKAYVIGECRKIFFHGKIVGIMKIQNEERLIVADKNCKGEYTKIKSYFPDELNSKKFKCIKEKSAGAVVYKIIDEKPQYLIIYSNKEIAGFPKGHIENVETEQQAAKREIFEEVGLKVELNSNFKESIFYYIDDTPIQKEVVFFLTEIAENAEINIDKKELNRYEFMSFEDAKEVLRDDIQEVLKKAHEYIKSERRKK